MSYTFNQFEIPDGMMGGITRFIEHGIIPGGFLQAVICNDLKEAVGRADLENMANLPAFVSYFYNEAPAICWGSKEKMLAWSKRNSKAEEL
jgi:hypothetical protein